VITKRRIIPRNFSLRDAGGHLNTNLVFPALGLVARISQFSVERYVSGTSSRDERE